MQFARLFVFFFILLSIAVVNGAENDNSADLEIGSEAPAFSLPDLDNNYIFLRDLCGEKLRKPWINKEKHVVILSFFATWCVPCKKEIPYLIELKKLFDNQPVEVFLVAVGEEREKVGAFLEKNKITLPVLFDQYQVVSEKYGANSLPRLVVIDQAGLVRKYKKGFDNPSEFISEMSELINGLTTQ